MPLLFLLLLLSCRLTSSFQIVQTHSAPRLVLSQLYSTFSMDGSEYGRAETEEDDTPVDDLSNWNNRDDDDEDPTMRNSEDDETPTEELSPVPLSKNAGNRFVAVVWDRLLHKNPDDVIEMHEDRIELTEEHVMFCRKKNLYNETFNTDSMVDILWSYQILSSDLQRVIGHAMCLESTALHYVRDVLSEDPIVQRLTGGDISNIPLYRWRHIRDSTLRMDDGRFGYPCMCLAIDNTKNDSSRTKENQERQLEYLIRSQKVIATGPLHPPTEVKEDNWAMGDIVLFNAKDRDDAIHFAEHLPLAQDGVYESLRVHFYNTLDITGKFVSENPMLDNPCADMKEAMEYWGYPVDDDQTPWLNF